MKRNIILAALLSTVFSMQMIYAAEQAGKVIIIKGSVKRIASGSQKADFLHEGSLVYVGDQIQSTANGSLKIILKDMSELTLAPSTHLTVAEFHADSKSPSVFLMKSGDIRAKVAKGRENTSTKMMIRTPVAVMGVRGTDFETAFNSRNQMNSLVTFEGQVAMAKVGGDSGLPPIPPQDLVRVLADTSKAVLCTQGQFSGVTPAQALPTFPVKISPVQFESLKNSSPLTLVQNTASSQSSSSISKVISPVPPGVDAKQVSVSVADVQQVIKKTVGDVPISFAATAPPSERATDVQAGQIAPPPGGFVDMKTALYIPPPQGSSFDPVTAVYIPPPSIGSVHSDTGAYVPPPGYVLDATRGFVTTSSDASSARTPASSNSTGLLLPGAMPTGTLSGPGGFLPGVDPATGLYPNNGLPPVGASPDGIPYYTGSQPQYPVYNPFLCPPLCNPNFQPPPPPNGPVPTTTVVFTIS